MEPDTRHEDGYEDISQLSLVEQETLTLFRHMRTAFKKGREMLSGRIESLGTDEFFGSYLTMGLPPDEVMLLTLMRLGDDFHIAPATINSRVFEVLGTIHAGQMPSQSGMVENKIWGDDQAKQVIRTMPKEEELDSTFLHEIQDLHGFLNREFTRMHEEAQAAFAESDAVDEKAEQALKKAEQALSRSRRILEAKI